MTMIAKKTWTWMTNVAHMGQVVSEHQLGGSTKAARDSGGVPADVCEDERQSGRFWRA